MHPVPQFWGVAIHRDELRVPRAVRHPPRRLGTAADQPHQRGQDRDAHPPGRRPRRHRPDRDLRAAALQLRVPDPRSARSSAPGGTELMRVQGGVYLNISMNPPTPSMDLFLTGQLSFGSGVGATRVRLGDRRADDLAPTAPRDPGRRRQHPGRHRSRDRPARTSARCSRRPARSTSSSTRRSPTRRSSCRTPSCRCSCRVRRRCSTSPTSPPGIDGQPDPIVAGTEHLHHGDHPGRAHRSAARSRSPASSASPPRSTPAGRRTSRSTAWSARPSRTSARSPVR